MLDTLTAADQRTSAGFESEQAKAIVAVVRSSEESLDTRAELEAALAKLETRLCRALWIQAGGVVGALVGLVGTAIAAAYFPDRYLPEGALGPITEAGRIAITVSSPEGLFFPPKTLPSHGGNKA